MEVTFHLRFQDHTSHSGIAALDFEGYKGNYEFNGNADEVFELFFGSNNPFQGKRTTSRGGSHPLRPLSLRPTDFAPPTAQADGSLPSSYYGEAFQHLDGMVSSMIPGRGPTQDQAKEMPVQVTLEEIFSGTTKRVSFTRQVTWCSC